MAIEHRRDLAWAGRLLAAIGSVSVAIAVGRTGSAGIPIEEVHNTAEHVRPVLSLSVSIRIAPGQSNPAPALPAVFEVLFDLPVPASTLERRDFEQRGTAADVRWSVQATPSSNRFLLHANAAGANGTLVPHLPAGTVRGERGGENLASEDDAALLLVPVPCATPVRLYAATWNPAALWTLCFDPETGAVAVQDLLVAANAPTRYSAGAEGAPESTGSATAGSALDRATSSTAILDGLDP